MSSKVKPGWDPLEGVSSRTTKEELMERLRKAAASLRRENRAHQSRVAAIEERLRAKRAAQDDRQDLTQVICSATEDEWKEAIEFLAEFDDLLPTALARLHRGGQVLVDQQAEDVVAT